TLLFASFLSDLGLFALPPEIARLTPKRMTAVQKRQFEKHPEASFLLLTESGSSALNENVLTIVREHHEYCDGSGYPRGLTAEKILMLSKVVVICGDLVRTASDFLLPPAEAAKVMFPEFTEKLLKEHPELVAKYERELLVPFFKIMSKGGL
ncbi:MAG: HD-GYP domain-containing protein, partial [Bdellovibrionota bacterium]